MHNEEGSKKRLFVTEATTEILCYQRYVLQPAEVVAGNEC